MRFFVVAAFVFSWLSLPAQAEGTLGMVTGPKTGTYIAIGQDIAKVAAGAGVKVEVKSSDGSIDNIKRINSKENAMLGIVQSDVLGFLSRSHNPETNRIAANLRMVLPLYKEEVHVLARKSLTQFSDLQGKRVVVGEEGSGNMLTAVNLLSLQDVKVADTLKMAPPEGVVAVLQGEADAVIIVGGKPIRLFKNLEDLGSEANKKFAPLLKEVHFLPVNDPRTLEEYSSAEIGPDDYSFVSETVPTVAVTAVLMTFAFADSGSASAKARCALIGQMANAVRHNVAQLKESGHPKWKEVNLDGDLAIWQKDRCSWNEPTTPGHIATPKPDAKTSKDLLKIINR